MGTSRRRIDPFRMGPATYGPLGSLRFGPSGGTKVESWGGQDGTASTVALVLAESQDVLQSVGENDMLAARLTASREDAPAVRTSLVPGWRCDVLHARLTGETAPIDAPAGRHAWLASELRPPEIPSDARLVMMSMAPAVTAHVVRHRKTGTLVQLPADHRTAWTPDEMAWLEREFDAEPPDMGRLGASLTGLVEHLAALEIELVALNVSTYTPDQKTFWYRAGDAEPAAITAARVNLMLDSLPADVGITVISLDRIAAEFGAEDAVIGLGRFTDEANAAIAEEIAERVVDLPGISAKFSPDLMRLAIPRYDRRTDEGVLVEWHVEEAAEFNAGDALFDVRFEDLHTRVNAAVKRKSARALRISVVATRNGYLQRATHTRGDSVTAGATVGIVTADAAMPERDANDATRFPVGVKLVTQ